MLISQVSTTADSQLANTGVYHVGARDEFSVQIFFGDASFPSKVGMRAELIKDKKILAIYPMAFWAELKQRPAAASSSVKWASRAERQWSRPERNRAGVLNTEI